MNPATSTLKKSPIFSDCSSSEIKSTLASDAKELRFRRNDYILREGFESPGIYVIAEGRVKLVLYSDSRPLVLEIDNPGSIFGHEAVLTKEPCHEDAIATERCLTYLIPPDKFERVLHQNERFAMRVLRDAYQKLESTRGEMIRFCYQPAQQKVAAAILYLRHVYSNSKGGYLKASKTDIARLAAVTRETATRIVKDFEREGMLEVDEQLMVIKDANRLLRVKDQYS